MGEGSKESFRAQKGKRKAPWNQKGKGRRPAYWIWNTAPQGNQTARTHERNETISRLNTPQPPKLCVNVTFCLHLESSPSQPDHIVVFGVIQLDITEAIPNTPPPRPGTPNRTRPIFAPIATHQVQPSAQPYWHPQCLVPNTTPNTSATTFLTLGSRVWWLSFLFGFLVGKVLKRCDVPCPLWSCRRVVMFQV